jgi:hypothetical protein
LDETFAFQQSFKPLTWAHIECESKANAYMTAINYVEQLDEPQKVKVPACVAKWISKCRELNWILSDLLTPEAFESSFARNTEEWLRQDKQNYDILARALLDGYEVEEEPKWKIINDQKYCLTSIEAGYGNSLHWAFDSTKKRPILFDNEETAMYTAYITGGIVEKVEV